MLITITDRGRIRVLACEGALTIGFAADEFEQASARALGTRTGGLVLDLRLLTYLDSAGIGAIVGCAKQGASLGRVVKVVLLPSGPARRIFQVTQLERAFELFDDLDSAIASFA